MSISIFMPGHNNWYEIKDKPFVLEFNPYTFTPMSFVDAADYTAKLIAKKFDNIYIGLSGGLDSEYVASVFLKNNIKFTPIIWRDLYNKESDYALYFCRTHKLTPVIIEKDLLDPSVYSMLTLAAKKFNSIDAIAAMNVLMIRIVEKTNGHFLMSTGMPIIAGDEYPKVLNSNKTEFMKCEFYAELEGSNHPGSFFCYTPELLYAYTKAIDNTVPVQEAKCKLYNIPFRPKLKYSYVSLVLKEHKPGLKDEIFNYGKHEKLLADLEKGVILDAGA